MFPVPRRFLSALLAVVLALALAACGGVTADDAETYIQGHLDSCYLGRHNQDYLEMVELTAEEAEEQNHAWNISAEAEILMAYYDIYPTDYAARKAEELVEDIYDHSNYQVESASKLEDGSYAVTVSVQPIDILYRYSSRSDLSGIWSDALDSHGIYTQEALDAMSDADYEALENTYAEAVLEGIRTLLPQLGYGKEQQVVLQLKLEDDYYTLVDTDLQHFDNMVIDYSGQYCEADAASFAAV